MTSNIIFVFLIRNYLLNTVVDHLFPI